MFHIIHHIAFVAQRVSDILFSSFVLDIYGCKVTSTFVLMYGILQFMSLSVLYTKSLQKTYMFFLQV